MTLGIFSNSQNEHKTQCPQCYNEAMEYSHHFLDPLFVEWRNLPEQEKIPHVDWQTGRYLQQLAQMGAQRYAQQKTSAENETFKILEIGCAAGFSTSFFLQGALSVTLAPSASSPLTTIDCIEHNLDRINILKRNSQKIMSRTISEIKVSPPQMDFYQGEALSYFTPGGILAHKKWDLIFIDAMKKQYESYFQTFVPHLNSNGMIVFDNLFLSGRTFHESMEKETLLPTHVKAQEAMRSFLQKMMAAETRKKGSWQIFAMGDGLGVFTLS